jgi:hypothetical protein
MAQNNMPATKIPKAIGLPILIGSKTSEVVINNLAIAKTTTKLPNANLESADK